MTKSRVSRIILGINGTSATTLVYMCLAEFVASYNANHSNQNNDVVLSYLIIPYMAMQYKSVCCM